MPSAAIALRVFVGGMRWKLADSDTIEVTRGAVLLGTLTGRALMLLVEHQLLAIEVAGWFHAPVVAPPIPRRPPQPLPPRVPFTAAQRAEQQARRRTRRKP